MTKGNAFIQGRFANTLTGELFAKHGFGIVKDIDMADVVVFTGGADINPAIYGEDPLPNTWFDEARDKNDINAIDASEGKFKVGICRGAQLLNCILHDGTLWQDINKHGSGFHDVIDNRTKKLYRVNSMHHQGIRLTGFAELLAYNTISTLKVSENEKWSYRPGEDTDEIDVEAAWYPSTKSYLFQGHPEFGGADTTEYFWHLFDQLYNVNEVRKAA